MEARVQVTTETMAQVSTEPVAQVATKVTATEVTAQSTTELEAQMPAGIVIDDPGMGLIGPSLTDTVTGRWIRKLTDFGLQQAQEVAEKKEKAAKLGKRKAAVGRVNAKKITPEDGGKQKGARVSKRTR